VSNDIEAERLKLEKERLRIEKAKLLVLAASYEINRRAAIKANRSILDKIDDALFGW